MSSLQELGTARHNGPLKRPLRVLVVAKGEPRQYGDAGKKLMNMAVCDKTTAVRAVVFDENKFGTLTEGGAVVLHNGIYKNSEVIINSQTRIFQTTLQDVPDNIKQDALHMIRPPAPPLTPIKDIACSPPKVRMTVRGIVTNVGLPTTATVNNRQSQVKTIEIKDATDKIKISLWRDMSEKKIDLGQCVEVTHVVKNAKVYEGEIGISTTQFTTINLAELPTTELETEILGIEMGDGECNLMAECGTLYSSNTDLLTVHLDCTAHDIELKFPRNLKMTVKGSEIVTFHEN